MRRGTIGTAVVALAAVASAAAPPAARSDGGPVASAPPGAGVESADGTERYVALHSALNSAGGTTVARISQDTGEVLKSRYLPGQLDVPGVGFDGSATGLAADEQTLVLAKPFALGRSRSEVVVLDAQPLRVRDRIALPGSFTVDAISPDGSRIYLVEYLSPRNFTQYRVRAYDLDHARLLPRPIVDPEESGEDMYGTPITRTMSPDGRWAYTLYDGRGEDFIHALDTVQGEAVCVDLDELQTKVWRLDMTGSADGETLQLAHKGDVEAVVDTKTLGVTYPTETDATGETAGHDGGIAAWLVIGLAAGTAAVLTAWLMRRRRAAPAA